MLKITIVIDKIDTAIDRLAKGNLPYLSNYDITICDVHPKRPDQQQLDRFVKSAMASDIIDFQYFKTAMMLMERFEWLKDKKKILAHHNPYSITEHDWHEFDYVVANNGTILEDLKKITPAPLELIPNAQDINFFAFKREFEPNKNVIMVANRIESKKGVLPVALACQELNLHLHLVGSISDAGYFQTVMATNVVTFHEHITDEELRQLYYDSTVHVCNSVDNFESGTMPMLEAMMCGVLVLTRKIGQVPDIYTEDNLIINYGDPEDVESIMDGLQKLIFDKKKMVGMREKAWASIKDRNFERRAYSYAKLYRKVINDSIPVSVIMPICDKPDVIRESMNAVAEQTHNNIELIVINDGDSNNETVVKDTAMMMNIPVRYIYNNEGDYGLARARNKGIIEATGDLIVFCDQRMIMDKDAVKEFVTYAQKRTWLYGDKNGKTNFVENFSAIFREDIVKMGMFNERINLYGGMSQEVRSRATAQGILTKLIKTAKAVPRGKSSNQYTKKPEIAKMKNLLWKVGLQ